MLRSFIFYDPLISHAVSTQACQTAIFQSQLRYPTVSPTETPDGTPQALSVRGIPRELPPSSSSRSFRSSYPYSYPRNTDTRTDLRHRFWPLLMLLTDPASSERPPVPRSPYQNILLRIHTPPSFSPVRPVCWIQQRSLSPALLPLR